MLQRAGINVHLLKYIQEFHFPADNEKHFGLTMTRDLSPFYKLSLCRRKLDVKSGGGELDSIITH